MPGPFVLSGGTHGLIQLSSQNGTSSGGQAYLAVGAPYNISVTAPSFGGCTSFFNVTSISAQWTGGFGQFLRKKDRNTGDILSEITIDHSIVDTPGTTYNLTVSPVVDIVSIDFFVGIPTSSTLVDTLKVTANYDNGQQDIVNFVVHMQFSAMTMNMVWPTASATKFDFTPYKYSHTSLLTTFYDNIRIAWNDANYAKGVPATQDYALGASAQGDYWPLRWSGTGQNTTESDGVFYLVQLVDQVSYVQRQFSVRDNRDVYTVFAIDSTEFSTTSKGLDNRRIDPLGPASYPWTWYTYVDAPSNGSVLNVPANGSLQDGNKNFVNYYGDNPSTGWNDVSDPANINIYYSNHDSSDFETYFVFHPLAGIPIAMKYWTWGFNTSQDNPTAESSLQWSDGATIQSNWTGSTIFGTPASFSGPAYVKYGFIFSDYQDTIQELYFRRFAKLLGSNSPNGAAMGGSVAIDANTGKGLPMKLAGNFAVMNTVL